MKQVKNWILGVALAVVLTTTASAADLQKGTDALYAGDYVTALAEFTPLAEAGDATAQHRLGWMYENGKGVAQDDAIATKWYRRAFEGYRRAAEAGDAEAQGNLGFMYKIGRGVAENDAEAVKWYRLAAEAGDAPAQYDLGVMYENGKGVAQDDAIATKWYRRAFEGYRRAAEAGNRVAQTNLGDMYREGEGVAQNYGEALKWYSLAAESGNKYAQNNLGVMYEDGKGVAQNYGEALKWYSLAANAGNTSAQNNLVNLGEQVNLGEEAYKALLLGDPAAHTIYIALAGTGDAEAQYLLGGMYAEGTGVLPNYHLAMMWFTLAATQRNALALDARNEIAGLMTSEQVAEAQKMARQCLKQNYKNCEQLTPRN